MSLRVMLCLVALLVGGTHTVQAQNQAGRYALAAEGMPLGEVLERLASKSGLPLVYDPALVAGIEARCAGEEASAEALLRCVLQGTGLEVRRLPSGTYVIEPKPPPEEEPEHHTVSGYVESAATGERLAGANVHAPALDLGTTTNDYGFFSLTLPAGRRRLVFSYVGYAPKVDTLRLRRDTLRIVRLQRRTVALEGVTVETGRVQTAIEEQVQMSRIRLAPARVESTPMLLGETDVLKTMQLLPGVKSGVEGTSGLYVRGGKPGQNLILLDGTPIYNASHLLGFLSVFNPDLVDRVELIKGGFPARYGGRLSSVIDVGLEEGNMRSYLVEGAVGLVSSRLTVQGPLVEDKTAFLVSGRRNYIDLLARPFLNTEDAKPVAYFYDLNAKVNHIFSPQDRVFLSFYAGSDRFGADETEGAGLQSLHLGWGNLVGALRWNHLFSDKVFMNARLTFSRYRFAVDVRSEEEDIFNPEETERYRLRYASGIRDWAARLDFEYRPNPRHALRFGAKATAHTFRPGALTYEISGSPLSLDRATEAIHALEGIAYIEDDVRFTERLRANLGVHTSAFGVEGAFYTSVQPRLSARYLLTDDLAAKGSFATMRQYVHLLTHANVGLPTDLWVPATDRLPPQDAWQAALGLARSFGGFEASLEAYYKDMDHVIAYEPGAGFTNAAGSYEDKVTTGQGWSYGLELFLRRRTGRTTGWLGYTLAWAGRRYDALNGGDPFPARYDRRHALSLVLTHRLSRHFDASLTWVYSSGHAVTIPRAEYWSAERPPYAPRRTVRSRRYYGERNGFRMPAYHRLDLGVNWHIARGQPEHVLSFGVYNAYNHKNAAFFYLDETDTGEVVARGTAIFPVLPYVSYSFSF